jgi:predicted metal-dependent hydrolase
MTDMDLKLRKVDIDFSDAKVHWNPDCPEFSHVFNAFSVGAPCIEPFLIKVMRQVNEQLPESALPQLRRDIELFNSQEGRHYRMHMKFNTVLHDAGYDTRESEAALKADYKRFLDEKGLKFCLAYAEGFETLGPVLSGFFFDRSPALMERWDDASIFLWLWHVAEEYEHRHVVNSVYKLLYDDDYRYRLYGLAYCLGHLFHFVLRESNRMVKQDLATGRVKGRLRARLRFGRSLVGLFAYALPRILFVAGRRSYDPAKLPPLEKAMFILDETSKRYGILEPT